MPSNDYPPAVFGFLKRVATTQRGIRGLPANELTADEAAAWELCKHEGLIETAVFGGVDSGNTWEATLTATGRAALARCQLARGTLKALADDPESRALTDDPAWRVWAAEMQEMLASNPAIRAEAERYALADDATRRAMLRAMEAELQARAESPELEALVDDPGFRAFEAAWDAAAARGRLEWEALYGEPYPVSLGDWQRLLVQAGVDPNSVLRGDIDLCDASNIVQGYLKRLRANASASGPPASPAPPPADSPTHSADFTSVDWFGTSYTFTKGNQAETVRVLWEEYKRGGGSLGQGTIREKLNAADSFTLRKLFRHRKADGTYQKHPAWGTMIRQTSKGVYGLVSPPAKKL